MTPNIFKSNPYSFSSITSLYISLAILLLTNAENIFQIQCSGLCFLEKMILILFSAKSLIVSFLLFVISFIVIQIRVQKIFLNRIRQIYKDLNFKSDFLISTSSIVPNMDGLIEDLSELAKIKKTEIESLKREDKYRKEFVGNVAHELKTPLFSIQGYISNLIDGAAGDKELLAKYLKRAKEKFGSWALAAAAYNRGINGIQRNLTTQKASNYFDLFLGQETSRYLFRIFAVKEIIENPIKYGYVFEQKDLYQHIPVRLHGIDTPINNLANFAKKMGVNYKLLKIHNPWLIQNHLNNKSRKYYEIAIPEEGYY